MNRVREFFLARTSRSHTSPNETPSSLGASNSVGAFAERLRLTDDIQFIDACLNGDKAAWDRLVEKYGRLVYWIALSRARNPNEADQVFERVFETVLRSLPYLRQERSLASSITIIARREAKRVSPNGRPNGASEHETDETDPQFVREQVLCAIWQLDPFLREFSLACIQEPIPPAQELAARFGIPVEDIPAIRLRCMKELGSKLATMGVNVDGFKRG